MKTTSRIACIVLLAVFASWAQRGHHDPTPDDRNAGPDRQLAVQRIDPVQIGKDANELAQLADAIPQQAAQAASGVVDKDLRDKLKRIEKLARKLRGELLLN